MERARELAERFAERADLRFEVVDRGDRRPERERQLLHFTNMPVGDPSAQSVGAEDKTVDNQ